MTEFFIARQPIFDPKLALRGYELLFRSSATNAAPVDMDRASATAQVLSTTADLGLASLVGAQLAFVNLPERFLDEPDLLPLAPGQLVLEVLEDVELNEARVANIQQLAERGYTIALDDFVYDGRFEAVLPHVDIVKLEIPAIPRERWAEEVCRLKKRGHRVLAEKVETDEEFQVLRELGCDFFQGYFFARPKVISGRRLASSQLALLQLLSQVTDPGCDVDALTELVGRDVALSVRVLNHVNSAANGLNRRVSSLREAIVYLGRERIRNIVALLIMARVDDKPAELLSTALVRARFCQLLALECDDEQPDAFFTAGLFSVLDALMDLTMAEVLQKLPVSEDLAMALLEQSGPIGHSLSLAIDLERGACLRRPPPADLPESTLARTYHEARQWADEVVAATDVA